MKRISILAGSVAALFSTTSFAADAIIAAEPEPVEYVRVCDAFGNGYFYMPGTETCLRVSGYVWFQVGGERQKFDETATVGVDTLTLSGTAGDQSYTSNTRARVNIDTRSDTELGELAARIRIQSDWWTTNGDGGAVIDQAWLRLGGLFMGYSESYWTNAYNTGSSNWGSHSWDGMNYGYQQRQLIGYTYNNGSYFLSVSAENDDDTTNWTPDFTGKIGGTFGGATVWLKAARDESAGEYGVGAGVAVDVGPGNLRVLGYYASGQNDYGANASMSYDGTLTVDLNGVSLGDVPFIYAMTGTPKWSALVSYGMDLSDTIYASIGGQYFADFYYSGSGTIDGTAFTSSGGSSLDGWRIEGNMVWTPVTNFSVRTEVAYQNINEDVTIDGVSYSGDHNSLSGWVRFQRSF